MKLPDEVLGEIKQYGMMVRNKQWSVEGALKHIAEFTLTSYVPHPIVQDIPLTDDQVKEMIRPGAVTFVDSQDAKDAARYRWLRVNWQETGESWWDHSQTPEKLDEAIDTALSGISSRSAE